MAFLRDLEENLRKLGRGYMSAQKRSLTESPQARALKAVRKDLSSPIYKDPRLAAQSIGRYDAPFSKPAAEKRLPKPIQTFAEQGGIKFKQKAPAYAVPVRATQETLQLGSSLLSGILFGRPEETRRATSAYGRKLAGGTIAPEEEKLLSRRAQENIMAGVMDVSIPGGATKGARFRVGKGTQYLKETPSIKFGERGAIHAILDPKSTAQKLKIKRQAALDTKVLEKARPSWTVTDLSKMIGKATREGIDVPVAKPYSGSKLSGIRNRAFRSIDGFFKSQGASGKTLAELYDKARLKGDLDAGKHLAPMNKALRALSDDEAARFAEMAEGRAIADTPALQAAVDLWNVIRADIANRAQQAKLKTKIRGEHYNADFVPREDYFPHFIPEDIIKSKKEQKIAIQEMVQSGWAKSIAEAESKFNKYVLDKVTRRYGNLEYARESFPIFERDPRKVLPSYIDSAYHRVAEAEAFGPNDEAAYQLADKIGLEGGDSLLTRQALDRIFGKEVSDSYAKELSGLLRSFQTITKLGTAQIQNLAQINQTIANTNIKAVAQGVGDTLGRNKDEARYFTELTGELAHSSKQDFMDMTGAPANSKAGTFLKKIKFTATEDFNRIMTANATKRHILELTKKLVKNNDDKVSRRALERLDLNPQKIIIDGFVDADDLARGAKRGVEQTQFTTGKFDLPYWWTSDSGKVLTQFKSFAFKQTQFWSRHSKVVASEAVKGNFRPFLNTMVVLGVTAPIIGELLGDAKNLVRNKKRTDKGLERYINNMFFAFSLGLISDVGTLATGKYGTKGTIGVLAGPTTTDVVEGFEAIQALGRGSGKPAAKFVTKRIPLAGPAITTQLFPTKYSRPLSEKEPTIKLRPSMSGNTKLKSNL